MRTDYRLHELDNGEFETLVVRICARWFGAAVTPFAAGKDGGRDGKFHGTALCYPSSAAPFTGHFVFQAKHVAAADRSCLDRDFELLLKKEHDKIKRLIGLGICDHYVVFTNRKYTAGADEKLIRQLLALGLTSATIVGLERLSLALDEHPDIRDQLSNHKVSNTDLKAISATLASILAAAPSIEKALIANTPTAALNRAIAALVGSNPDASIDELLDRTLAFSETYSGLQDEIRRFRITDEHSRQLVNQAQAALTIGNLPDARSLFRKAIQDRQPTVEETVAEYADLQFGYGKASLLDRDWQAADTAFKKAAEYASLENRFNGLAIQLHFADQLLLMSQMFSDLAPLRHSIALARSVLAASDPGEFGTTFAFKTIDVLQRAYSILSQRATSKESLKGLRSTITVCQQFLKIECECLPAPERRRFAINLATALTDYGERDASRSGNRALVDAVALLEDIAANDTKLAGSIGFGVHNGKGCALKLLAERSMGKSAARYFEAAAAAFETASNMYAAGSDDWCIAKANLGIVLWSHAENLDDQQAIPLLKKALQLHQAALDETSFERAPSRWAWMKHNLASTRTSLGERSGATGLPTLEEANREIEEAIAANGEDRNSVQSISAFILRAYIAAFKAFYVRSREAIDHLEREENLLGSLLEHIDDDAFIAMNLRSSIMEIQILRAVATKMAGDRHGASPLQIANNELSARETGLSDFPPYLTRLLSRTQSGGLA
ncbi:hypothetical protein [Rhizobium leguminosarum]